MSAERDELAKVLQDATKAPCPIAFWSPAYGGPTGYGELFADAILAAGYGKSSGRRPSVVTDAANRVAYFLNWHQGDNDIAADFPSGPSLYASDLQVILNELQAGGAK